MKTITLKFKKVVLLFATLRVMNPVMSLKLSIVKFKTSTLRIET